MARPGNGASTCNNLAEPRPSGSVRMALRAAKGNEDALEPAQWNRGVRLRLQRSPHGPLRATKGNEDALEPAPWNPGVRLRLQRYPHGPAGHQRQ